MFTNEADAYALEVAQALEAAGIRIYDDFAHHPPAIATTIEGLRRNMGGARLVAVLEARSNTMRMGVHKDTLAASLAGAHAEAARCYEAAAAWAEAWALRIALGDGPAGFTVAGPAQLVDELTEVLNEAND